MFLIALLAVITPLQATIRVGRISNATWRLGPTANTSQYANITQRTCEQCLCLMLMTNGVSTRMACQPSAMTCQLLFSNATVQLIVNETSTVYLLTDLKQDWITTDQQPMTTATTFIPVCNPACLNAGVCIGTNLCQCPSNLWVGSYCQTPAQALWKFDNSFTDAYGMFSGVGVNGPTFRSPGIDGFGTCLYLNSSANQTVRIPSPPFLSMVNVSFTVSTWAIANSLQIGNRSGAWDNAIIGQLDSNTLSRSLHIVVRKLRTYMGFYGGDTQGSQIFLPQQWYHLAFVYDQSIRQQYVYVNGVLDGTNGNINPYQGTRGDTTIGATGIDVGSNYWDGCLDRMSFHGRVKNSSEVLWDATQTVYYPFESDLIDRGPLGINGNGTQIQYVATGRVGQALDLTATPSFVKTKNLIYLGTHNRSYSLSIWIRPRFVMNGTIIHVASSNPTIGWSIPMLGFTADGRIAAQSCSSNGSILLVGPPIDDTQWTHVAVTYNPAAEFQLWVNGTQVNSTSFSFLSAGVPVTATLGSSPSSAGPCTSSPIVMDDYSGFIDEFRLYSRVLSAADVYSLANP